MLCSIEVYGMRINMESYSLNFILSVFMWEVLSNGAVPWKRYTNKIVARKVILGQTLKCEDSWPEEASRFLYQCWAHDTQKRITLKSLKVFFEQRREI